MSALRLLVLVAPGAAAAGFSAFALAFERRRRSATFRVVPDQLTVVRSTRSPWCSSSSRRSPARCSARGWSRGCPDGHPDRHGLGAAARRGGDGRGARRHRSGGAATWSRCQREARDWPRRQLRLRHAHEHRHRRLCARPDHVSPAGHEQQGHRTRWARAAFIMPAGGVAFVRARLFAARRARAHPRRRARRAARGLRGPVHVLKHLCWWW